VRYAEGKCWKFQRDLPKFAQVINRPVIHFFYSPLILSMYKGLVLFFLGSILMAARPVPPTSQTVAATLPGPDVPPAIGTLLLKYGCTACHAPSTKLVGPSWQDIAAKKYSKKRLMALITKPEPGNWPGYPPMVAQTTVTKEDLGKIAGWLVKI
jgi:cytochrome c